ncbi:acyl-CoA dehydrogenase family protein [Pseudooceanicola sp.]|uniref:acyl-CoA dehydrogenase family protein n=1 Tax=Pseudooceanicola sp. TaxID=1914328 RepID=UPI00262DCC2A|nr:acyl-CoA dehydrogenase family protein [Pseudooceanicola sp.]MDF1855306.1 acyl-CoA dehydrogenase family protein [Pseudooceanicola sp.]
MIDDTAEKTAKSFGAWAMPDEYRELQATVRRFVQSDIKAVEDTLPHDATYCPSDKLKPLQDKAKSLGLWCVRTPAEFGGAGLNLLGQAVFAEEAKQVRMGLYNPAMGAFGIDPPNVIWEGNRQQIEKYGLPGVDKGSKCFVAISESSGGADPGRAIQLKAEQVGNKYILNGSKMWITGADKADWGIVYARTGGRGRSGITSFIVDRDTPGLTVKEIPVIRAYSPFELHFDNVEIPIENRLGEEGQGFALAEKWLVDNRISYSAGTLGVASAALDIAIAWAKERETFGSKLADKQAVQWMLADSDMELRAARLIVYDAAWKGDLGEDFKLEASIAKVTATETAGRIVDRAIQIMGGLGLSKELPLERWYRELRIHRIGEGPSEVHRMVVARNLLSGRR